jgi:hypothetical protein
MGNKKGRGETAPTFLIRYSPLPVHPWSKVLSYTGVASGRTFQRSSATPTDK